MVMRSLLLALTVASCAAAAETKIDARTVVRVDTDTSRGSGVYLGAQFVLSAEHVVRDRGEATVSFVDGPRITARVVARDAKWDQSLLQLASDPQWPAARIADDDVKVGQYVEVGGWAAVGKFRDRQAWSVGQVTGFKTCSAEEQQAEWATFKANVPQGFSGGPVFNADGEVLGVLWGTSDVMRMTAFCRPRCTRRFLLPWRNKIYAMPAQAAGGCSPGACPGTIVPGDDQRPVYDVQPTPPVIEMPDMPPSQPPVQQPGQQAPQQPPQQPVACCTNCERLQGLTTRVAALEAQAGQWDTAIEAAAQRAADALAKATALEGAMTGLVTVTERTTTAITGLTDRVTAVENEVTGLQSTSEQGAGAIQAAIAEQSRLLQQLQAAQAELAAIRARLDQQQQSTTGVLEDVMLYYTSREASGVAGVDAKIAALKERGVPIVVTYLRPTQAEVFGIPRIFIPSQNKNVVGVANCEYYLASLLPR